MSKKDIIEFFDGFAHQWDEDMVRDEEVITTILDNARVKAGVSVLDVACGDGCTHSGLSPARGCFGHCY